MRPPKEIDRELQRAARELSNRINEVWPDNGLHRPPKPSTGNSRWTVVRSTSGWVATSGRRYGQWVQPVGIAGKANGNPPHGFELSRTLIPQLAGSVGIELQNKIGVPVTTRLFDPSLPLGRRVEFKMDPMFPEQILIELYKNGVPR